MCLLYLHHATPTREVARVYFRKLVYCILPNFGDVISYFVVTVFLGAPEIQSTIDMLI